MHCAKAFRRADLWNPEQPHGPGRDAELCGHSPRSRGGSDGRRERAPGRDHGGARSLLTRRRALSASPLNRWEPPGRDRPPHGGRSGDVTRNRSDVRALGAPAFVSGAARPPGRSRPSSRSDKGLSHRPHAAERCRDWRRFTRIPVLNLRQAGPGIAAPQTTNATWAEATWARIRAARRFRMTIGTPSTGSNAR